MALVASETIARLRRYGLAAAGPIGASATQFLLSLLLVSRLDLADFGRFSFLLVVSQFGIGLWSALFTAPLLVSVARTAQGRATQAPDENTEAAALLAVSLIALVPAGLAFFALGLAVGAPAAPSLGFALYGAAMLLRQFARAWSLAHAAPGLTIASDLVYASGLLAGTLVLALGAQATLGTACTALVLSVLAGLVTLAPSSLWRVAARSRIRSAAAYRHIWQRDARWSLLGVLTTEMTVNSHSYLVTGWFGPQAFAPIAATALLIRPVTVAINALVEFERARFAGDLAAERRAEVRKARLHLHQMLLAIWVLSLAAGALLLMLAPDLLFHGRFPAYVLWLGSALWFAIVLARGLHAPEGAVLQAAGQFRQLARISCWTALVSVVVVVVLLATAGPLWSLGGIVIGEGAYAMALHRASAGYFEVPARPRSPAHSAP